MKHLNAQTQRSCCACIGLTLTAAAETKQTPHFNHTPKPAGAIWKHGTIRSGTRSEHLPPPFPVLHSHRDIRPPPPLVLGFEAGSGAADGLSAVPSLTGAGSGQLNLASPGPPSRPSLCSTPGSSRPTGQWVSTIVVYAPITDDSRLVALSVQEYGQPHTAALCNGTDALQQSHLCIYVTV